jgi:hypothetical protein
MLFNNKGGSMEVNKQITNKQKNASDDGKGYLKGMPAGMKIILAITVPIIAIVVIFFIFVGTQFNKADDFFE